MSASPESAPLPDARDVDAAARRIADKVRRTPVVNEPIVDDALGCRAWFKCENLQRTGAFKFRGACNAIALLDEAGTEGDVATHSSGNHGAALSLAATLAGRGAHVVMPVNASPAKIEAVRRFGGQVHFCAPTQAAREAGLAERVAAGCLPVPPYDDARIVAGQGTAARELLDDVERLDALIAPVGGGGLVSGAALTAKARSPRIDVFAAEPEGAADTAASLERGERVTGEFVPDTVADGLRAVVGEINFRIIRRDVTAVLTVDDEEIIDAMRWLYERTRLLVEPSSATVVAALRRYPERFRGRRVGVILSGGNLGLCRMPFCPRGA
jgi:threonine dehydratase